MAEEKGMEVDMQAYKNAKKKAQVNPYEFICNEHRYDRFVCAKQRLLDKFCSEHPGI
jgi:hypothetical protein